MNLRLFGSILLVAGTSIGAGLLALPVATAAGGFIDTSILLLIGWLSMTFGAFCILEVNLRLPPNNNLISMAKNTLGGVGQLVTWLVYLLLLYSLLAAYMSGGTDITHKLLSTSAVREPGWIDTLIFTIVLGLVVIKGVRAVDWTNRGLMIAKLGSFIFLIIAVTPHASITDLSYGHASKLLSAVMVVITSFGFAIIIPSLRVYLKDNAKQMRIAVAAGSFIALLCYWFWCFAVQGNLAYDGRYGLANIAQSKQTITAMTSSLSHVLANPWITGFVHFFASICIFTSFLGVALSLSDFLADGMKLSKRGKSGIIIFAVTFLPPLLIVFAFPSIFIKALSYAGIFCVILLIIIPALMALKIRQHPSDKPVYQVFGGNKTIYCGLIVAFILLVIGIVAG